MAKKVWKATTTIRAGEGHRYVRGDTVTGLTKEQMQRLWEAGALVEGVEDSEPQGAEDGQSASTEKPAAGPEKTGEKPAQVKESTKSSTEKSSGGTQQPAASRGGG